MSSIYSPKTAWFLRKTARGSEPGAGQRKGIQVLCLPLTMLGCLALLPPRRLVSVISLSGAASIPAQQRLTHHRSPYQDYGPPACNPNVRRFYSSAEYASFVTINVKYRDEWRRERGFWCTLFGTCPGRWVYVDDATMFDHIRSHVVRRRARESGSARGRALCLRPERAALPRSRPLLLTALPGACLPYLC